LAVSWRTLAVPRRDTESASNDRVGGDGTRWPGAGEAERLVKTERTTASTEGSTPTRCREQAGWCSYDWANASFQTVVITVFLGPYLTTIARAAADSRGFVHPFGIPVAAGSVFPYAVSLSVLLQVIGLPFLGALADSSRQTKLYLALFTYLGVAATVGLFALQGASFGLGGGVLLALTLLLVSQAGRFGLTTSQAVRVSLAAAGVWWGGFALIALRMLPNRSGKAERGPTSRRGSLAQLRRTLASLRHYPQTLLFLLAYLLYADGIHTVTTLSAQFGQEALGISLASLTRVILMVQLVAFVGALAFNVIARAIGSKAAILIDLLVWTATLVYAYGFLQTELQFVIMAAVIAVVLGGGQALSRSVFSLMIPAGREAEYFGLYEISDRGTSWLGPLLYGLTLQLSGSYRLAIGSLVVFFLIGVALLAGVNVRQAALAAGNLAPERI
jgi:UMF1 family MFS transporter